MMNSFEYSDVTLQNIEDNKNLDFIFDGDNKKIHLETKLVNKLPKNDIKELNKQFPKLRKTKLYNHLKGLSKDEIIGITIREFNENRYFREVKIEEYLKENQELKQALSTIKMEIRK